mmetsp:Transcript_24920/g.37102  ORF Transcript_24920/g.37102 Transcript_24920/m.37102 type:complete len:101 (+) Transcript_24920:80-382(+)
MQGVSMDILLSQSSRWPQQAQRWLQPQGHSQTSTSEAKPNPSSGLISPSELATPPALDADLDQSPASAPTKKKKGPRLPPKSPHLKRGTDSNDEKTAATL